MSKFRLKSVRTLLVAVGLLAALLLSACSGGGSNTITVGSKNFTENILMGEMLAQLIENKMDVTVKRDLNLGGTQVVYQGVQTGDIDLYLDYDGTAYEVQLKIEDPVTDPDAVYPLIKERMEAEQGVLISAPLGFNNTYTLALPSELAEQYNLKTYSDLAAVSDQFVLGVEQEFLARKDGYDNLVATYGFNFKDVRAMDTGLKYKAIENGEVQVINAFATDGQLPAFGLTVLEDDLKFFPPYNAMFIVRKEAAEQHPELMDTISVLTGIFTDEIMQNLNYRVDHLGETVEDVARDFLQQQGLLD